jgi:peptidyl-prolyl isomerase H (cyclophilin H)
MRLGTLAVAALLLVRTGTGTLEGGHTEPARGDSDMITLVLKYGEKEIPLKIELFEDMPYTVKNFKELCKGGLRENNGLTYGYVGTRMHRIMKKFIFQGGDVQGLDGLGEYNYHNKFEPFKDEDLSKQLGSVPRHTHEEGVVSMANKKDILDDKVVSGRDTNGCQFFIVLGRHPHLDGHFMPVGKVVSGMDKLKELSEEADPEKDNIEIIETVVDGVSHKEKNTGAQRIYSTGKELIKEIFGTHEESSDESTIEEEEAADLYSEERFPFKDDL